MSDMVVNEIHAVMVTVLGRAHRKKEEGRTFLSLRLMIKPVRFISVDICFVWLCETFVDFNNLYSSKMWVNYSNSFLRKIQNTEIPLRFLEI